MTKKRSFEGMVERVHTMLTDIQLNLKVCGTVSTPQMTRKHSFGASMNSALCELGLVTKGVRGSANKPVWSEFEITDELCRDLVTKYQNLSAEIGRRSQEGKKVTCSKETDEKITSDNPAETDTTLLQRTVSKLREEQERTNQLLAKLLDVWTPKDTGATA